MVIVAIAGFSSRGRLFDGVLSVDNVLAHHLLWTHLCSQSSRAEN
jgi:hypothetical protein